MLVNSKRLFNMSKKIIPHGVNSPVRYFEPHPIFFKKSNGSSVWDEDGNKYIDFCNGYGTLLLGHRRKEIISSVTNQLRKGTLFCAPTDIEIKLTKLIINNFPSIDKVRLVNTGTEATMSAIRLVRGYTTKKKIIKFEGCYHGSYDSVLIKSGSSHANKSQSYYGSNEFTNSTIVVQYNDICKLEEVIEKNSNDIAGVIIEPILANMGVILPKKNFLSEIRNITRDYDIPLIFDEIVTGFRISPGGAQQIFGIVPDITLLGKILGHGFPIGAICGKNEIMDQLAPLGKVYQASTFAGNPVSTIAAINSIKTINKLKDKVYPRLEKLCRSLVHSINDIANDMKIPHEINSISSMYQIFFTNEAVTNYVTSKKSDTKKFHKLFTLLLKNGIFISPSQFETVFLSYAHTKNNISKTIDSYYDALKHIKN